MDYISLKAAVSEAGKRLPGSRVSDAWQSGPRQVVLVTHRGPGILLSIDPDRPGLYLSDPNELPGKVPSPFTDLLRARIKGTTIVTIHMPDPGERIVTLTFAATWPAKEGTPLSMVFEVMGRRSNLMLLEERRILQPLRAVSKDKSSARPVVAGDLYRPPPPRPGIPVEDVTAPALPGFTAADTTHEIMEHVRGLSPYTARQAIQKALLRSPMGETADKAENLAITIREMVASAAGESGYLLYSEAKIHLSPFEPDPIESNDKVQRFSPFSEAAAVWRRSDPSVMHVSHDEPANLKKALLVRLERIGSALEHMDAEEERCQGHDKIRVMAEALLIHAGQIAPGSKSVQLPDPYDPGLQITIPLNRTKSPQENANDFFGRARRLERGLAEVSDRRDKLGEELKEVRQAMEALEARSDQEPARKILETASPGILKRGKVPQFAYRGPGRRYTVDGFTILVGKSSTDNEKVTFKAAGPKDLWLHARDYPGSHVVVLTQKRHVPDKVLFAAAALAAKGSGAKNDTSPEIMVTERKWVRKLKGGKPGQVTVERFRTIRPRSQ